MAVGEGTTVDSTSSAATADLNLSHASQGAAREWRIIAETIPGASHLRAGKPNQDALLQIRESSVGLPLVVLVSDGHGSDKCFRSDRGSRLAVTIGAEVLRKFLTREHGHLDQPWVNRDQQPDHAQIESRARKTLPAEFAQRWKSAVEADLKYEPFTEVELNTLETKNSPQARQLVEARPLLAYGATALAVGLTPSFVLYLQLGDGEMIVVSEAGEVSKPLPEDKNLIANETTSLCTDTAAQDFRFSYQPLTDPPPALILMTTDGYANSFADDAGFLKVGSDLLEMLRADGFDTVNRSVRGWLEEATRIGSGDDCTLAIICRMDALEGSTAATTATHTGAAPDLASPPVQLPEALKDSGNDHAQESQG